MGCCGLMLQFYGHVEQYTDSQGRGRFTWVPGERVSRTAVGSCLAELS